MKKMEASLLQNMPRTFNLFPITFQGLEFLWKDEKDWVFTSFRLWVFLVRVRASQTGTWTYCHVSNWLTYKIRQTGNRLNNFPFGSFLNLEYSLWVSLFGHVGTIAGVKWLQLTIPSNNFHVCILIILWAIFNTWIQYYTSISHKLLITCKTVVLLLTV